MPVSAEVGGRGRSGRDAVAEVHDTVAEWAVVQQLEIGASVGGQRWLPPPTRTGRMNSWHSSTSPALRACAARCGPPTVRSLVAVAFMSSTEAGSKVRSSRVLAVDTASKVVE